MAASKENRRVRELDRSGVRARGVIAVVHPLERSPHGHRVTVTVAGGDGRRWEAVDASGLNGYLVREGTPVELTYAAGDPLNIRVERAAFPLPPQGLYPLYPHGLPKPPSPVWPLLYAVGGAALVLGVGVLVLNGGEAAGRFVPLLFAVLGPVFLVLAVRGLIRRGTGERRLTAEATGVVTDACGPRYVGEKGTTSDTAPIESTRSPSTSGRPTDARSITVIRSRAAPSNRWSTSPSRSATTRNTPPTTLSSAT
ncbi:hypothetical protein [Nocardiopsis alba]